MLDTRSVPSGYLVMTNVPPEEWAAAITRDRRIIGRSSAAEIRVSARQRGVSRLHAAVWSDDKQQMWIEDLDSTSGTQLNEVWLEAGQRVALMPGDRLRLGALQLLVKAKLKTLAQFVAEAHLGLCELDASASRSIGLPPTPERQMIAKLTPSELGIVLWMYRGVYGNDELAEKLGRSANTVRTQIGHIFTKLQVKSRAELMSLFRRRTASPQVAPVRPGKSAESRD